MIDHNLKKIFRMTGAQSAAVISPLRVCVEFYVWRLGGLYQWSHTQVGWMFTLFVIFESIGTLLGGVLRDLCASTLGYDHRARSAISRAHVHIEGKVEIMTNRKPETGPEQFEL